MDCLRYLGMADFNEIDRMTLYEYGMRMKALRLRQIDREYEIHLQAWANHNVQATKRQGKDKAVPVFKTFKQFFDYEKRIEEVTGGCRDKVQEDRLKRIAVKVQDYERRQKCYGDI